MGGKLTQILVCIGLVISSCQLSASNCKNSLAKTTANQLKPLKKLNPSLYSKLKSLPNSLDGLKTIMLALKAEEQLHNNSYTNKMNNPRYLNQEQSDFVVKNNKDVFLLLTESDIESTTDFYKARIRRVFLEVVNLYKVTLVNQYTTDYEVGKLTQNQTTMLSEALELINKDISSLSDKSLSLNAITEMLQNFKFFSAEQTKGLLKSYSLFKTDQNFSEKVKAILLGSGFSFKYLDSINFVFLGHFKDSIKDLKCCGMMCGDCTFGLPWIKK